MKTRLLLNRVILMLMLGISTGMQMLVAQTAAKEPRYPSVPI
ncbi:MAG TPA: hypothetical protein PLG43_07205 [Spirochaetia bacterium]|nr:hypothetical protein [Spirochaetia bacterium]